MIKKEWVKRLLAVVMSLVVAVTFVPLLGDCVYAEGEDEVVTDNPVDIEAGEEATEPAEDVTVEEQDGAITNDGSVADEDAVKEEDTAEDVDSANANSDLNEDYESLLSAVSINNKELSAKAITPNQYLSSFNYYMKNPNKVLHIDAKFTKNVYVAGLFLDGSDDYTKLYKSPGKSIVDDIDMSSCTRLGNHEVTLLYLFSDDASDGSYVDKYVRISIYAKPSSSLYSIETYHNYMNYMAPWDGNIGINYNLGMDYSTDGVHWVPCSTMTLYGQSKTLGGLRANTNYSFRTYYVSRDGSFSGKETNNFRYLGTYRTGVADKVKVKSITVKAYKVKKKKQKVYGYYTGLYLGKRTYYKYKLKIIVKLKKKPGTAGIWINGKKFKGNKKKYVVKLGTMTSYYKPKGKKYTVAIYKYHNASWGGYSPMYVKKKKIK